MLYQSHSNNLEKTKDQMERKLQCLPQQDAVHKPYEEVQTVVKGLRPPVCRTDVMTVS